MPEGTYDVLLDLGTLPPGVPVPEPVRINVDLSGPSPVVTQLVGGTSIESAVLDFALEQGGSSITGTVTLGGEPVPCFILVIDEASERIVHGVPTSPNGSFSMSLGNGSFLVAIDKFSLPPGITPPAAQSVRVSGGFIAESAGTSNDGVIPFVLSESGATLNVFIEDAAGTGVAGHIVVVSPTDRRPVAEGPTDPGRDFVVSLPDGTFDVIVDPTSLPFDLAPPVPSRIEVSGETITLTDAGSGTLDGSRLEIETFIQTEAAEITVRIQDSSGNPIHGVVRVGDAAGNIFFFQPIPPTLDGDILYVAAGSYTLSVAPGSVPPGSSLPDPVSVTASGGPPTAVPSDITFTLTNEQVTLTGTILDAVDGEIGTLVTLDVFNREGFQIRSDVPLTPDGSDADYALDLGEGTYELVLHRRDGVGADAVILPEPTIVTVSDGVIQNADDDDVADGTQINIELPEIKGIVRGTVDLGGNGVGDVFVVVRDPVDNGLINETLTNGAGGFDLALPAGVFQLLPDPGSLGFNFPNAIPPEPFEINVSADGDVEIANDAGLCTGSGPDEDCTGVDFQLEQFQIGVDATITGVVTARRSAEDDPEPLEFVEVLLIDPAKEAPRSSAFTNENGEFDLIAPAGVWFVVVDPFGTQLDFPTIPATPVRVSVSGTSISEENVTGDQNEENDGVVNFALNGASAFIQGRAETSDGIGIGVRLVVSTADKTEIPEDFAYTIFTEPDGTYFMPVGQGNFKLWVAPDSLPPGFLPPSPTVFSVEGADVFESDTYHSGNFENDGIINPVITAGGGSILARLVDDNDNPVPGFVALLVPSSNPNEPPRFINGEPSRPDNGDVNLTAGDGSYFLEVDPNSLPPGIQPPPRVNVSVSTEGETTTVTFGDGAETFDDNGRDRVVLRTGVAGGAIRGTLLDGQGFAVPGLIQVIDAANDRFVRDVFADPATGQWNLALGDGAYDLEIDPFSLPPGFVAPSGVRVSVDGATITESNTTGVDPVNQSANAENDGLVNFVANMAGISFGGFVRTPGGEGAFAHVGLLVQDTSGEYNLFVGGGPADPDTGFFKFGVSDGTYRVELDPGSIPPGFLAPEPVVISVSTVDDETTVEFPDDALTEVTESDTFLVLQLREGAGGISGQVLLDDSGVPAFVAAHDAATGHFLGGSPTDAEGNYGFSLPQGTFDIGIDPFSLPQGLSVPAPLRVTVGEEVVEDVNFVLAQSAVTLRGHLLLAEDGFDPETSVDCSDIFQTALLHPLSAPVLLVIPSNDPNTPPTLLAEAFADPSDGFFSLPLAEGTFELHVDGGALPPGVLPPPPATLSVTGTTLTIDGDVEDCSNDAARKLFYLEEGGSTIEGFVQVENPGGGTNGIGAFVEVRDPTEGHFIGGSPTDPFDGRFQLTLGDSAYDIRVSPESLPPGLIPPAAVRVSGGETVEVETVSGVTFEEGVLTITVTEASLSISGQVQDQDGGAVSAIIMAFDAAGSFRGDVWSDTDGQYQIFLAPGSYTLRLDPFSLPSGLAPDAEQSVVLGEASLVDVDFTLGSAPGEITGIVFADEGGETPTPIPAFVEIFDSSNGAFVGGGPAEPDENGDFRYRIPVGAGSFRVGLEPGSVPPGFIAPPPVSVEVSISEVDGSVTYAEEEVSGDNDQSDGEISFELVVGGTQLSGRLLDQGGEPVFGLLFLVAADGSGVVLGESGTDPEGNFSFGVLDGTFKLEVDPGSLPPGFLAPPPANVIVTGSDITVDGQDATSGVDIVVGQSTVQLTGTVTSETLPVPNIFVELVDPQSLNVITGSPTDAAGMYALPLVDGEFLVQIDPFSLPGGISPPVPVEITVSGNDISVDEALIAQLDFDLASSAAVVTVEALDDLGFPIFAALEVRDAEGESIITTMPINAEPVDVSLAPGNFLFMLPGHSLPPNVQAPAPVSVSVAEDGSVTDGSGVSDDALVQFVVQEASGSVVGSVSVNGSGEVIVGVEVTAQDIDTESVVASAFTDATGQFSLPLAPGEYDLEILGGLPVDAILPPPLFLQVFEDGSTEPPAPIDILIDTAVSTLTGTVTVDGIGTPAEIVALVPNLDGGFDPVAATDTDGSGQFALPLGAGTFGIIAILDDGAPSPVIPPLPFSVLSDGSTLPPQPFEFYTPGAGNAPPSWPLSGSITAGGVPFGAELIVMESGNPLTII
ncbi:MAG: carboxypeptidase-like regulatory domain-containing protein, partial [Planctomycetota bacterium]